MVGLGKAVFSLTGFAGYPITTINNDTRKIMKLISVCIIALAFLVPNAVLAVRKYDSEKICKKEKDNFSACDLLVEQAVAKDILGVIERKGAVLRIHLKNGKIL